ncbi:hypothetical protein BT67DRAFT_314219 [Trichocladium antarcticum]|uniref:Uncharacterized protein n=1 Tax=Trichocladium antarcticum TaxID=1450529 RepID=A0AAN6UJR5_9PEZI|nr:hypothetical protein BT67DRAFT_314219 [Trichocladium antarcticum]
MNRKPGQGVGSGALDSAKYRYIQLLLGPWIALRGLAAAAACRLATFARSVRALQDCRSAGRRQRNQILTVRLEKPGGFF